MNEVEDVPTQSVVVEARPQTKKFLEKKYGAALLWLALIAFAALVLWLCFFSGLNIPNDH
jgi:hypothetical protein